MPTEIDSLEIRINAKAKSAEDKVDDLIAKLDKLSTSLGKINGVKLNGLNINGVSGKLNSVENVSRNVGNSLNGLGGNTRRTTRIFNKFSNAITKSTKKNKSFIGTIKSVRSGIMTLYGAMSGIGSSVNLAQDYIEDFNYFTVALNKVGQESKENWKEAGYSSAQEYADSFKDRFGTLQKQMTGYTVDTKTGELDYNAGKNLGLDISKVMQFQSSIAQITNSAGMLGETSIMTSKALSMLSADWSSLANQDLSTVMKNMQSGIIGQSRAMYKYGIDITNANLQNYAYKIGLEKSVSEMTQAEKMQLRLLVILKQSKVAYGDLARTINQPANQLRMLQEGFVKLSRTVGQIFLPIIQNIYPYLNAVVMVLQEFAQWIAKLTGADKKKKDTSINLPDYEPAEEGSEKIADNTAKAAKSAKKLSDNLQGFDIINKLSDNDSSVDSSDSTSGNGAGSDIDLSSQIATALGKYEKIWNEAFKSNENKAVQLANKIKSALLKGWKTGDFTEVGKSLATWINNGLEKIPWTKIKKNVKNVAKSFATFLNGSLLNLDWVLIGETIAEGFNTAIDGLYTFLTTFNFLEFGKKVGSGINSAIEKFNWSKLGKTLGAKMRGIVQFAFGAISNIDFSGFGKRLGDGINGFFNKMGKVDKRTGLTGWQELGKSLSDSIKGILDTINTSLSTVEWLEVGKAIGGFLGSIDWSNILLGVGKTIVYALWGAIKAAFSALVNDPVGVTNTFVMVIGSIFVYKKLKGLKVIFKNLFKSGITDGINSMSGLEGVLSKKLSKSFSSINLDNVFGGIFAKGLKGKAISGKVGKGLKGGLKGTIALYFEALAIKLTGGLIKGDSKAGSKQHSFATGLERFGGLLLNLLNVDLKGVAKDLKDASNSIEAVVNGKGVVASEEAERKGTQEQLKKNTRAITNATQYEDDLSTFGVKVADKNFSRLSKDQQREAKDVLSAWNNLDSFKKNMKSFGTEGESAISLVQNAFDTGVISAKTYNSLISKNYKSFNEFNASFRKSRNAQKYMNGSISQYNNLSEKMDKSLKNLGYSSEELSAIQATLNIKLQNGEITFDDYKKIVDKSYKSTDDLYKSISKIAGKKVATSVVAEVKGIDDIKSLGSGIENVKSKNVAIKAEVEGIKTIDDLKNLIGKISNKRISALIDPKLRKDWYKEVKDELQKRTFSLSVEASINNISVSSLKKSIKSMDGSKINYTKLASVINSAKERVTIGQHGELVVHELEKSLIKYLKKYGVNYSTYSDKVKKYATGGFPGVGEFFVARENGPELVGNIGSRNAVVNNDQIVQSVSQGVAQATYAAVKAALSDMPQQGGGDVYIDGDKITSAIMGRAERITRSRGVGWQLT